MFFSSLLFNVDYDEYYYYTLFSEKIGIVKNVVVVVEQFTTINIFNQDFIFCSRIFSSDSWCSRKKYIIIFRVSSVCVCVLCYISSRYVLWFYQWNCPSLSWKKSCFSLFLYSKINGQCCLRVWVSCDVIKILMATKSVTKPNRNKTLDKRILSSLSLRMDPFSLKE